MEKSNKDAINKCRIVTPVFKAGFVNIFKAVQVMGKGDPKFSISMFFDKKTTDMSPILKLISNAKFVKWPNKSDWPDDLNNPITDGDKPKYIGREGYKGHWVIKATSNEASKPGVVDYPDGEPIINQADFYPGCFARAQIFARVWEYMGKEGVHFILDHVQKIKDGTPFGGKKSAKEAFGAAAAVLDEHENIESDSTESISFM